MNLRTAALALLLLLVPSGAAATPPVVRVVAPPAHAAPADTTASGVANARPQASAALGHGIIPTATRLARPAAPAAPKTVVVGVADERLAAAGQDLGPGGPLGAFGPLGTLGPVGGTQVSPSFWMQRVGSWRRWAEHLTSHGGPLSDEGPLSEKGSALSPGNLQTIPESLRPGGKDAVLGPGGPLGPHGALGALGPMGAHGYAADSEGHYHGPSGTQRTVDVPYRSGVTRRYELFEHYTEAAAKAIADNDTSFMVSGTIEHGEQDRYDFQSRSDQFVVVSVVPEKSLDNFGIAIQDPAGYVLAQSDSGPNMNFVQLKVPKGTKLTAVVSLNRTHPAQVLSHTYRLCVVGSENHEDLTGGK